METRIVLEDVISRMQQAAGVDSERALSRELGLSSTAITSKRQRKSVPYWEAAELALRRGISLDWLILGRELHTPLKEQRPSYSARPQQAAADPVDLMRTSMQAVETAATDAGVPLAAEKRQELSAAIAQMALWAGQPVPAEVVKAIVRAAGA